MLPAVTNGIFAVKEVVLKKNIQVSVLLLR